MGVAQRLGRLKTIASERVDLNNGVGTILFDGHASMHRAASRGSVAVDFALKGDVKALVLGMLPEMRRFEAAGWDVVVVFDGAAPPAKARASKSRSGDREKARELCRRLQAHEPVDTRELEKRARGAVEFTPTTVAKVTQMLQHSLRAECVTAPFEADSQLKALEDLYSASGRRCFVRANDSDLVVLGVQNLLWEVKMEQDGLVGQCIRLSNILQPQGEVYGYSSMPFDFLRQLHGVWSPTSDGRVEPT